MTAESLPMLASSSAWTKPVPHAFNGCVLSTQFVFSTNGVPCPVSARSPLPDWMLYQATLYVAAEEVAAVQRHAIVVSDTMSVRTKPRAVVNGYVRGG